MDKRMVLVAVLAVLPAAAALAEMYKWVDENGETHYTQSPPPGDIKAETIKPPPAVDSTAAQKELDELSKGLDTRREGREKEATTATEEQQYQEARKQKCEQAQRRLQQAERPLTNFVDADGTERRATEEERQQQIGGAKQQVKEFCE
jgi:Skp family chaperone for outer membrane proteins